jgi:hypothetical protein
MIQYKAGWKWVRKGVLTCEQIDTYVMCAAAREWLHASDDAFADLNRLANAAKWDIPFTPTVIADTWLGDDFSAHAREMKFATASVMQTTSVTEASVVRASSSRLNYDFERPRFRLRKPQVNPRA